MSLPTLAAITVVRDEAVWLPRWVAHYAAQCGGAEHLVVIDDGSTDGSTDDLPCDVRRLPGAEDGADFEKTRMRAVSALGRELLQHHDAVLLADADEFVVADPTRHASLRHLLAARPEAPALAAVALNLVHHPSEPPLAPDRPLLDQRGFAIFVPKLCKPHLKRVPAGWARASHGLKAEYAVDPELWMLHAKFADRDLLRDLGDRRARVAGELGRAVASSWQFEGDALVDLLEEVTRDVDPARATPFEPDPTVLAGLVEKQGPAWVTQGDYQVGAMRRRPVRRVPARLAGTV